MDSTNFRAVALGSKNMCTALSAENPHWLHSEVVQYMYENDDAFKVFYDRQPSAARLAINPKTSISSINNLADSLSAYERGSLAGKDVLHRLTSMPNQ